MWRYLVGMVAGILLVAGGVLWWRDPAVARRLLPDAPAALASSLGAAGEDAVPEPPAASEQTREEKRFSRYDHDKDGKVGREEFLAARRKAFARLDTDHDGRLGFDEYAAKTITRFADADGDRSGALTAAEFAATRIPRKAKAAPRCPPAAAEKGEDEQ